MKKTLKIFLVSFTLSSFAIWAADELFFSVSPSKSAPVAIPQKNIALFFQENESAFPALKTKSVEETRLAAIVPVISDDTDPEDDISLFGVKKNAVKAVRISSVEDAADIPLEYGAPQKMRKKDKAGPRKQDMRTPTVSAPVVKTAFLEEETPGKNISKQEKNDVKEPEKKEIFPRQKPVKTALNDAKTANVETDTIPFETGDAVRGGGRIEIVSAAPQSQIAMAGDHIAVDTLAIEQKDKEEAKQKREWQPMEAAGSPWVVAQANKYAKNSKAVEDFAAAGKEAEIENLLSPQKMEEEGQEVKTAEMVKNILIPIPEDILNDKNLTPQLVSSKKNAAEQDFHQEEDVSDDTESGPTLLKSITSIFSGSSSDDDTDGKEEAKEPKKKRKKGLFAAFSEDDRAATKILPAEMKLAFQPGRAEISGQTLRWIQAFANKAAEDPNVFLEIRIDKNSSYALQQRRLELLHTILGSKGMDSSKVNTVFTSREPNSFIIRTLRLSGSNRSKPAKTYQRKNANYQTW